MRQTRDARAHSGPLMRVEHLAKSFADNQAVSDLDLEVGATEIFGLVGPDGAGKTTTLRMIAGLSRPDAGRVWIQDQKVTGRMSTVSRIGYMPQHFGLYEDLSVSENLEFFGQLRELDSYTFRERSQRLLAMTRLEDFRKRPAGKLSGGMKQKLALCCSLLHEPELLLLDEPTNGVDPVSRRDFWKLLRNLALKGLAIILATAYLDEAERCHRVGLLLGGRLIANNRPDRLIDDYASRALRVSGAAKEVLKKALSTLPEVVPVRVAEKQVVFIPPERNPSWLSSQLARQGLEDIRIEAVRPTLEDIFVLMSQQEQAHAGQ